LVDFGLSGIIKDNSSFMEVKVGTNGYQAPEVVDEA
jgi:serine/threonine protein kinase